MSEFDWVDVEDDTIIENVSAVAVYLNPTGSIVIRQKGTYGIDKDQVIVIPAIHLTKLIAKMEKL